MDERFREQIDGLESDLASARKNRDVLALRRIEGLVRQVLDQFRQDHDGESKQSDLDLAKLLNLHGQSLAALFDLSGQMQQIQEAVSEFRQSLKLAEPQESPPVVFAIRANLAFATLRYAEQINSRRLLGNSLRHLTVLKGDWPLDQAPPSLHPVINCYCLAKFRLGQVSGDRGLIKEACRDFSAFLGNRGLHG
ncbi:hypothetical protein N9195_03070 [bacterium]|nr:hypothetical protein [bacterium]